MSKLTRRDTLRYLTLAGLSSGLLLGCRPEDEPAGGHDHDHAAGVATPEGFTGLTEADRQLLQQRFFTDEERETVRVLANIIIPADYRSGSAGEAGCVEFIEFMTLDQPVVLQVPLRGGLKWLDNECLRRFEKTFTACAENEQRAVLDDIAYPETAPPVLTQGVAFFNLFRNLVATGFWTSQMGIEDLQYLGNRPTVWEGPPAEWVAQLGVEKEYEEWKSKVLEG